jgi:mannose-1-phosphate guanylyltransferase
VKRAAVILAGGAGTRLRPLSSDAEPKQFLKLFDGLSLLQLTYARLARILSPEAIFVSTNAQYVALCREQLPALPAENILSEPARRNTAPAIALSTFTIESRLGVCSVSFLASDHYIGDVDEFMRVLRRAYEHAEASADLVAIGIEPTDPNTGYGYLETGEPIAEEVLRVRAFTEKPDLERAGAFLRAGNYVWNASMFVWRSDVFHRELLSAAPAVAAVTVENYETMPSISIDYALMERSRHVVTIRGRFAWSDVGTFEALERVGVTLPEGIRR